MEVTFGRLQSVTCASLGTDGSELLQRFPGNVCKCPEMAGI